MGKGEEEKYLFRDANVCVVFCYCLLWLDTILMSVVVIVYGSVRMFVVYQPMLKIVCFSLGVLKYIVGLCKGCNGCFLFVL